MGEGGQPYAGQEGVLTAAKGQVMNGAQEKEHEGACLIPESLPQKWYDF